MNKVWTILAWLALAIATGVPLVAAARSPLLAWRDPVYIVAGFAGVVGLALLLVQPLLASGRMPGFTAYRSRQIHRWTGAALVLAVLIHVAGLWATSPPDVMDALTFTSPTPFSAWGVIAMWAIFAVAIMAAFRHRLGLRPRTWRFIHTIFAAIIVSGTIIHGLLIDGTMEQITKVLLSALALAATVAVIVDLGVWRKRPATRHE